MKDREGAEESLNSEEDKANDRERERETVDVYVRDTSGEESWGFMYLYFILRYVEPSPGFRELWLVRFFFIIWPVSLIFIGPEPNSMAHLIFTINKFSCTYKKSNIQLLNNVKVTKLIIKIMGIKKQ